jgi:AraC-like DNA-binding protein
MFEVSSASLVLAGTILPDPSWSRAAHTHATWEFVYFLRGRCHVSADGGDLSPREQNLLIYPPCLLHGETSFPRDPVEFVYIQAQVQAVVPSGVHLIASDPTNDFRWLSQHILAEYCTHGCSPLADNYLRAFLLLIDRAWETAHVVKHDALDIAVQYLQTHYMEGISPADVAHAAGVSAGYLSHGLRRRLGMTPTRYLTTLRLDLTRHLLTATDLPVAEIAARVGYSDAFYFSRVFTRECGISPSGYRAQ